MSTCIVWPFPGGRCAHNTGRVLRGTLSWLKSLQLSRVVPILGNETIPACRVGLLRVKKPWTVVHGLLTLLDLTTDKAGVQIVVDANFSVLCPNSSTHRIGEFVIGRARYWATWLKHTFRWDPFWREAPALSSSPCYAMTMRMLSCITAFPPPVDRPPSTQFYMRRHAAIFSYVQLPMCTPRPVASSIYVRLLVIERRCQAQPTMMINRCEISKFT
ncbi:hypothetical protein DFH09DRAFT_511895 [Mycena vulgaris]|nr:hypothetical protein DFH09DRAFT_511895 [Mycena vulgaris]